MIKGEIIKERLKLPEEVYDRFPKESKSYLDNLANQIYRWGIYDGLRLAKQWTSVDKKLPPHRTECLVKSAKHGTIKAWFAGNKQWVHDTIDDKRYNLYDVTHWRVIG